MIRYIFGAFILLFTAYCLFLLSKLNNRTIDWSALETKLSESISCEDSWLSLSSQAQNLYIVDIPNRKKSGATIQGTLHVLNDFHTTPKHEKKVIELPNLRRFSRPSTFEDQFLPVSTGVAFINRKLGIDFYPNSNALNKAELYNIENEAIIDNTKATSMLPSTPNSQIKGNTALLRDGTSRQELLLIKLENGEISSIPISSINLRDWIFSSDTQLPITMRHEIRNQKWFDYIEFESGERWYPSLIETNKEKRPKALLKVSRSFANKFQFEGLFLAEGYLYPNIESLPRFDTIGIKSIFSIQNKNQLSISFDVFGYSFQTETIYWTSDIDHEANTASYETRLNWLQKMIDQIIQEGGKNLYIQSAARFDEDHYLIIGYMTNDDLQFKLISKNINKKLCGS